MAKEVRLRHAEYRGNTAIFQHRREIGHGDDMQLTITAIEIGRQEMLAH